VSGYIVRRLLAMIPTLVGVSLIVFFSVRLIPGDIVLVLSGARSDITEEQRDQLRRNLGLDDPAPVQYLNWARDVLQGDLGQSLKTQRSIADDIVSRMPVTIELAILAALVGLFIGIPAGIIAALRRGTRTELAAQGVALVGLSVPDFWLGTMLLLVASRYFGWYPGAQYVSIFDDPGKNLSIFVLPAFAVGISLSASLMRMTRSALLDVMASGYIVTARSKGLREAVILRRHAFKNALIPIITVIGLQLGYLLGGVVIVETVFNLPGVGRYTVQAISDRDYPVVQATVLLITLLVLVISLVVDLLYAYVDPRIKYGGSST
jgi:peptide/nickel transport system permease protein